MYLYKIHIIYITKFDKDGITIDCVIGIYCIKYIRGIFTGADEFHTSHVSVQWDIG